jgi:chromosome segregation ATPase
MNAEILKSELQQVFDKDIALRKEFNELKRSLSDYRNQLILRDEDCARLQVNIDVLNTKLSVMERDNGAYKAELASFKELKGNINEQIREKQEELDARFNEIQELKNDLNSLAAGYEQKIEEIKLEAANELAKVKEDYTSRIEELNLDLNNSGSLLQVDYENKINLLNEQWSDKQQELEEKYQTEISNIIEANKTELLAVKSEHESRFNELNNGTLSEVSALTEAHQHTISALEAQHASRIENLEHAYTTEMETLRAELVSQKECLESNNHTLIENLKADYALRESELIADYENRLEELRIQVSSSTGELTNGYEAKILELKNQHDNILGQTIAEYETKLSATVYEYEEKLSLTLFHSNAQNSKLNEELALVNAEKENAFNQLNELTISIENRTQEINTLNTRIEDIDLQLSHETANLKALNETYDQFRLNAELSECDRVEDLMNRIATLSQEHHEVLQVLHLSIETLNEELRNISGLLEATTNSLGSVELALGAKTLEHEMALEQVEELQKEFISKVGEMETEMAAYRISVVDELNNKETEFQKLLVENANLINEIDMAQDGLEAKDAELQILNAELEEVRNQSLGKAEHYKEILSNKNFEITNLEANNAALNEEVSVLRNEVAVLSEKVSAGETLSEQFNTLNIAHHQLLSEKQMLLNEIESLKTGIHAVTETTKELNDKIGTYENEVAILKYEDKTEEYKSLVNELSGQVELLNVERVNLLEEKEQMADQLLKMNEVIGAISQNVENENIDVTNLNNHRKNVILANNSEGGTSKNPMKQQINDLVREIDKCIALLSA